MIVGNGLIANAFRDVDKSDVIFFASGVSNSLETDKNQFLREENLIHKTISENSDKLFIYFSTCSIYDSSKSDSAYVSHKLNMEYMISTKSSRYLIIRVSNAVGRGGNENLLMNHLYKTIKSDSKIIIHTNAKRNLIDVEDIVQLVLELMKQEVYNKIVNIAYPKNFSISEIVQCFENSLNVEAHKVCEDKGASYTIDAHWSKYYFAEELGVEYLNRLINKYYNASE